MQTGLDHAYAAFRDEVHAFLDEALDDDLRRAARLCTGSFQDYETSIRWHRILHARGWVAPAWPRAYGGTGWDLVQRHIWGEACAGAGAPSLAPMGLAMCGPVLIGHGSPAQQAYYLPRILSGEDYWCQGYSEPGSGSDLASLRLRADVDGDHYVLNGTKIWTTHAHHANRMFALVRTDFDARPQRGITFLLLDMTSAGIEVDPIVFASGDHEVNQVFFRDVRVPRANRVGAENNGWTVAKYLLEFERGGGGGAARARASLRRLRELAAGTSTDGTALAAQAGFAARINAAEVQLAALESAESRILAAMASGGSPGPESSLLKNLGSDLGQRMAELAVEAAALYALPYQPDATGPHARPDPAGPEVALTAMPRYLNGRAASIAGGSHEVQKNIIAKQVLGL